MIVKSGAAWVTEFATAAFNTGAATNATGTPVGTLVIDGVDNAATVTITNIATGRYKASVTIPAATLSGANVCMAVSATVSGVASVAITATATVDNGITVDTPWYRGTGLPTTGLVAAYLAKGAASQAASYSNLANPGTYDLTTSAAPGWSASGGWEFSGAQFLAPGIIPSNNYWSVFVRYSSAVSGSLIGSYNTTNCAYAWELQPIVSGYRWYRQGFGGPIYPVLGTAVSGVMGFSGRNAYFNGAWEGEMSGAWALPTTDPYIGAVNANSGSDFNYFSGKICAALIYSSQPTPAQVSAITAALQAL